MDPLFNNKTVDMAFWVIVRNSCDHTFEFSMECGDVVCIKCFINQQKYKALSE